MNFDLPGAGSSAQTTGSISFLQPSFLRGVSKSSLSSCPPSFSFSCPTSSSSCSPLASGANDPSSNQLMQPVVQVEEQVQTSESRLNESRAAAQQSSESRSVVEDSACKKFVSNLLNKSTPQQKRVTRRCSASKCPAKSCDLAETSLGTTACPVQPQLTECAPPASHVHPSRTDALDQSTDQHGSSASSLPPPSFSGPRFTWGDLSGADFTHVVESAYAEVVTWRKNVFNIPSGKNGKAFVSELARLFRSFAEGSALQQIAIMAAMIMPHLLLQKSSRTSKARDHCELLGRRLQAWHAGDIDGLLREGRVLQRSLEKKHQLSEDQLASRFSRLMLAGKTKAALRLLSEEGRGSVLPAHQHIDPDDPCSKSVLQVLKEKHPPPGDVLQEALLSQSSNVAESHPVLFDNITSDTIRRAALRSGGSAGPSGLDAAAWQRMCTSFKGSSTELCAALALFARRISTQCVDFRDLAAYTNCRLIALDKSPGIRPIGVGEVCRRIVGKAILEIVRFDVRRVTGTIQLCAGQEGGCEAAVHATRMFFSSEECEGVLLVDASNAFNSLNRKVALHNVAILCPSLATVLSNTYGGQPELFVDGETIYSREGTTQGDPLAMVFYALATIPFVNKCKVESMRGEVWFADDATGAGRLSPLRTWWDKLNQHGPLYGYYPNGAKTWLVVKQEKYDEAVQIFSGTEVRITTQGKRHLGAALGSRAFVERYVSARVEEWVSELQKLSRIAASHPQAAYSGFVNGVRTKWLYLMRTIPEIKDLFHPLEDAIRVQFIPSLTGRSAPADLERELMALPTKLGGLGITNPVSSSDGEHRASLHLTSELVCMLVQPSSQPTSSGSRLLDHPGPKSRWTIRKDKNKLLKAQAATLKEQLSRPMQYAMELAAEKGASNWLSALPLKEYGFALSKSDFRDALHLRYGWELSRAPSHCICGQPFNADHALSCPTGGLPALRHNEVRDYLAARLSEVCSDVATEPTLQPLNGEQFSRRSTSQDDNARVDIRARGFWRGGRFDCTFFDVRVFNPFAQSNRNSSLDSVYRRHERQKQRQYEERVVNVEHASFTPLVFSSSAGASRLTTKFLQHLASRLALKREEPYSAVMACLRTQLNFSLLRSAILCLRGCRSTNGHPRHDLDHGHAADFLAHHARLI